MAIRSSFFNSINGDRKYNASNFAEYFASFVGNGIFAQSTTNLQVVEGANMTTKVRAGKGWINGYYLINDSDLNLTHDSANGTLKRIDRVVMRLNYSTRTMEIVIKKGVNASNPVAPTLQRDTTLYELALADVFITNGATAIRQANITDQRFNDNLCGIVKGLIDDIDTTNLFAQYEAEFREWLEDLQSILDENAATNLLNLINQHKNDDVVHNRFLLNDKKHQSQLLVDTSGQVILRYNEVI